MNKKEKWLEDTLNSLEGIQKAEPRHELLDLVMAKLPKSSLMPKWQLRMTAVAASLLIALNVYVFDYVEKEPTSDMSSGYVTLVEDFSLYQLAE